MQKVKLPITKTARYYQIGKVDSSVKNFWIVLHGYGMLAEYFIKKFKILENDNFLVIAPEGMNRFYLNGTYGRVGASWMTKEEREDDIEDNMNYLNALYDEHIDKLSKDVKVTVFGFSQGSPTACRWIARRNPANSNLMIWASDIPADVLEGGKYKLPQTTPVKLFIGDEDEYIDESRKEEFLNRLDTAKIRYELIEYKGKHKVYPEILKSNL